MASTGGFFCPGRFYLAVLRR